MTTLLQRQRNLHHQAETRAWAHEAARRLAVDMCLDRPWEPTPYGLGLILEPGERAWLEIPARFLNEPYPFPWTPPRGWRPAVRPWLITTRRIAGRLGDGLLCAWRWTDVIGCDVSLHPAGEYVALDFPNGSRGFWTGPGIAPLAVAAVGYRYGHPALVDHPGLTPIRSAANPTASRPRRDSDIPQIM